MKTVHIAVAIALLAPFAHAAEPTFGRLFFTHEERLFLDRVRRNNGEVIEESADSSRIVIDGIVKRQGGKSTAWIGRSPQYEKETGNGTMVTVARDQHAAVAVRIGAEKEVRLKAGQSYDVVSGAIRDVVGRGGAVGSSSPVSRDGRRTEAGK